MTRSLLGVLVDLGRSSQGAIAPTVALSLFGLIAAGGIAFDYARLASMDTELQQAADQAALAAATQLDHSDGAQDRAETAIQAADSDDRLAANLTRFANDSAGASVEIEDITFCSAFDDDIADTSAACTETNEDDESKFVIVTTELRTANYALTPVVAAFSGAIKATAVAGVESSICNIAPLFVCTDDASFPDGDDIGKGLLMKTGAQNSWFPGNYGYLDFGPGNPAVEEALMGHGLNGCQPIDESNTAPGNKSATDAVNTRFDVYSETGQIRSSKCTDLAEGSGCPDQNTGKDLTMKMTWEIKQATSLGQPTPAACGTPATPKTGNPNPSVAYADFALNSAAKGMPRDTCHYSSCTGGNFGDGLWTFAEYMAANHPTVDPSTVPKEGATPTRYETYQWEIAHKNDTPNGALDTQSIGAPVLTGQKEQGANTTWTFERQCAFRKPRVALGAAEQGRRILPVLAANCAGLNGASNLDEFQAIRVFNVFLTEPSFNRTVAAGYPGATDEKEIYGEIIGPAESFAGGGGFQYYSRSKPYLVR